MLLTVTRSVELEAKLRVTDNDISFVEASFIYLNGEGVSITTSELNDVLGGKLLEAITDAVAIKRLRTNRTSCTNECCRKDK